MSLFIVIYLLIGVFVSVKYWLYSPPKTYSQLVYTLFACFGASLMWPFLVVLDWFDDHGDKKLPWVKK